MSWMVSHRPDQGHLCTCWCLIWWGCFILCDYSKSPWWMRLSPLVHYLHRQQDEEGIVHPRLCVCRGSLTYLARCTIMFWNHRNCPRWLIRPFCITIYIIVCSYSLIYFLLMHYIRYFILFCMFYSFRDLYVWVRNQLEKAPHKSPSFRSIGS